MKKIFKNGYLALIVLFLYAPIVVLMVFSFNDSKSRIVWAGFTVKWYLELFKDDLIMNSLYTTLLVSTLAAIISTVIGTAAAVGFYNMKKLPRKVLLTVNNIPVMNPDIITGVSLMILFIFFGNLYTAISGEQFRLSFLTLLLAHITFNIPYVVLSVLPKLRQLDPNLFEAALDLGAKSFYAFRKVILPEIAPGVITGFIMAFTLSFDDFAVSYFTAGTKSSTLAMTIFAMTKRRVSPEINALSTIMFLSVLILLIIVNVRQARDRKRSVQIDY